jgi:hypothetical protein
LTPTFRDVNKKYSTRYYLSLVLIDEGTFMCMHDFMFLRIMPCSFQYTDSFFIFHADPSLSSTDLDWWDAWGPEAFSGHFLPAHPTASHSPGQ